MKKISIILAALAACFSVSCTKEAPTTEPQDPSAPAGMKKVTITATAEGATKTSYTDNGEGVGVFSWTEGDQISVMASDNNFYTFTTQDQGPTANFSGMLPVDVELGTYALYPASDCHYYDASAWQPYFGIDKYKDLTGAFSADLPMTAKKGDNGTYTFKHATSALLFTFTNIPDGIVAVELSFENESLQFSGRHKAYYAEPWSLEFLETGNADNDRKFIRKVAVESNTAKVYLPFTGTLWSGYDNTINIVGYDGEGNKVVLLENKLMPGNNQIVATKGQVIPVAPFKIPVDLKLLNWTGDKATTANVESDASYSRISEMNVLSDEDNLYIRMIASVAAPFEGTHLDLFFCDGSGDDLLWSGYWTTTCTKKYYYQHKGELDATGAITKMRFYTLPEEGGRVYVSTISEVIGDEVYWYFTYPLSYFEDYKSDQNKLYISAMLWKDWDAYGVIPTKDAEMLEVTLP